MRLLGDLTPAQFLATHWQKKPLLVRQAIPGFAGFVAPEDLFRLASRRDAVARTVTDAGGKRGRRWRLAQGPFPRLDPARVPKERFTLLVQGVEGHHPAGWELLQRFSFVPRARVDDLMISFAAPGGSVGPHYDLYDVFLLQGPGRRRWQISTQTDLDVDEAEDVRVLKRFRPTDEWVLEPGDMLYLPPKVAHWGVAVDPCLTYSIGFLAPTHEQIVHNFLAYLGQEAQPQGLYEDPDLTPPQHPAEIGDDMIARVERALDELRWDGERVAAFYGRLLTGPKPGVSFDPPKRPLDRAAFAARLSQKGRVELHRKARMLFRGEVFLVCGEALRASPRSAPALRRLADERRLQLPVDVDAAGVDVLHQLHRSGIVLLTS